jgi:hypothetical protein
MIKDDEILHGLSNAIDLMDDKEYRGAKKLIVKIRNKVQKKVDEEKRQQNKLIAQAKAKIGET